jgi:cytochrome b561
MVPTYRFSQKFLHWMMAIIILSMLVGGFFMEDLPQELKPTAYLLHKSFGFLILVLIPIRLALRLIYKTRSGSVSSNNFHKVLIKISVPVLYLMMLTMALSGFVMTYAAGYDLNFFGVYKIPSFMEKSHDISAFVNIIHKTGAFFALFIFASHILAAFYHHFYLKDESLKSMLKS